MRDWLLEKLLILAYSQRTQWTLVLGLLGFLIIPHIGAYFLLDFQLNGPMSIASETLKQHFFAKYDKAAWIWLLGFFGLAYKLYIKDTKRFHNIF